MIAATIAATKPSVASTQTEFTPVSGTAMPAAALNTNAMSVKNVWLRHHGSCSS